MEKDPSTEANPRIAPGIPAHPDEAQPFEEGDLVEAAAVEEEEEEKKKKKANTDQSESTSS